MFGVKKDEITVDQVRAALSTVMDPDLHQDIVSLGMISGVQLREGGITAPIMLLSEPSPREVETRKRSQS